MAATGEYYRTKKKKISWNKQYGIADFSSLLSHDHLTTVQYQMRSDGVI